MLVGTFMTTPSTQCDGHANNNNDAFWGGIVLVRHPFFSSLSTAASGAACYCRKSKYDLEEARRAM